MNVYKISDIIKYEFLKIPKVMFANEDYRRLSSDAKLTYSMLYDRLSLSKLNGWINENDEVYLIYTREEVAYDLGISYKKAITAFKELTSIGLIFEKRCGRGMPNKIFIVKPELDEESSKKQVKNENLRTADSVCLESERLGIALDESLDSHSETIDMSAEMCQNSTSRPAETEDQDMPKQHTNNTDNNKTNINNSYLSQSVKLFYVDNEETIIADRQKEKIYDFDEILESCQLETFDDEERKLWLIEKFATASVNAAIASLNSFFGFAERPELKVKSIRVQRQMFCRSDKELTKAEYERLLRAAYSKRNERLMLVMQTICSTGIRVSELRFITVEAIRMGNARVNLKGKIRLIILPKELCSLLLKYARNHGISTGSIFITRNGRPLDRHTIWKEMKNLCKRAGVSRDKVFPHNLRHLFARTYYSAQKDIVRLADVLGHSSINTTRIYTIEDGHIHRQQVQKLGLVKLQI